MLSPELLRTKFLAGLPYDQYVAAGKPNEQANWAAFHGRATLTPDQAALIASFSRGIKVLCISGTWCGDCVQQCPFLDLIAGANPAKITLSFLERNLHLDFADQVQVCGGHRVPVVLFLNEDFEFLALAGDRTLTRYRAIAARSLGPSCPLPGAPVPADEIAATLQDWVSEFERVHLLLRLSPKLRRRYGD